jgi:hypothetical protein
MKNSRYREGRERKIGIETTPKGRDCNERIAASCILPVFDRQDLEKFFHRVLGFMVHSETCGIKWAIRRAVKLWITISAENRIK